MKCSRYNTNVAVRVPADLETKHDILPASLNLLMNSPSPFGLKVCAVAGYMSSKGSPQKLFYVTKQAAWDRDPARHAMNGTGVNAGWYMIGERGMFHVHAGVVKEEEFGDASENGFAVSLKVDGQDTHAVFAYKKEGTIVKGRPSTWRGFTKSSLIEAGSGKMTSQMDTFCFEDITDALEGSNEVATDTGTISMRVRAGMMVKSEWGDSGGKAKYEYAKQEISAKTVAREGRSMRVGSGGCHKMDSSLLFDWRVRAHREVASARVDVSVRSREWLRSRRIIDDHDEAFQYVDLVKARNAYSVAGSKRVKMFCDLVNGNENEGPRKRRHAAKKEQVVVDVDRQEECENVIDLTE